MPELPPPKARPHPWGGGPFTIASLSSPAQAYAELDVTSNFTFLAGASHPDELVQQAAILGHAAAAITDKNSLAGIVRAHIAAKEIGIPLAVGCRLDLRDLLPLPSGDSEALRARQSPSPLTPLPRGEGNSESPSLSILVYPTHRAAYARLCRLLTLGKRRATKGECQLALHDLLDHQEGLLAVVVPPAVLDQHFIEILEGLKNHFDDDRLSLAASRLYGADDHTRLAQLAALSSRTHIPLVATNAVHYHAPGRRALQDVLTCIRHGCTIDEAGLRLFANAERHLKSPDEMACLFASHPDALARSVQIAQRAAAFSLDELRYEYPDEIVPPGRTPMQHLIDLTWGGAATRYPNGIPDKVRAQIEHEFKLIDELNYAPYFLTVQDLVVYARSRDILCQGRGAAANSAVCYCLGVTAVDPDRIDVLFERFISKERNEPPDIDIDFEHERREEVIQYIYQKYGRDRAALIAEVITYRGRSAIREVGKALGLSLDCVDRLAKSEDWWSKGVAHPDRLREMGLNPSDPTIHRLTKIANEILGFPRHLSQHVGGFVITRGPLCELVPIENAAMEDRTVIEWDKDDIDAMGMLKVDVLGLGMLTCISKALRLVNGKDKSDEATKRRSHEGSAFSGGARPALCVAEESRANTTEQQAIESFEEEEDDDDAEESDSYSFGNFSPQRNLVLAALYDPRGATSTLPTKHSRPRKTGQVPPLKAHSSPSFPLQLHTIPPEDPAVYDMIGHADTVGVFQIESRAQMSMLPRLRPRCFYDLVIEVAIVRPGPIQGDMVHPYLRRRNGEEAVTYPDEAVKRVLSKTLGVPLFQEQAMSLAIVAAGFTPGEADQLRRAIAAWKTKGNQIAQFGERLMNGMVERGYDQQFAARCFEQIKGFSGYGFPESHAASFALLVYVSSWLKCHYPAAFACALLNSQPMGFYAPAQIVRDAQEHGVPVRPVDVNCSQWDCTLEKADDEGNRLSREPIGEREANERGTGPALRLGLRQIKGLREEEAHRIVDAVKRHGHVGSVERLWRLSGVRVLTLRRLAAADAFGSMGLDRQQALWQVRALRDEKLPIFEQENETTDVAVPTLPPVSGLRKVAHDYMAMGLSLRSHPMSFIREKLDSIGATPAVQLKDQTRWPHGRRIIVAGVTLVRQRPSTANGIVFMTIEDESGIANLILRPDVYQRCRKAARHGVVVLVRGRVERQGEVVHVLVHHIQDIKLQAEELASQSRDFH